MTTADQALAQLASARRRLLAELEGLDEARFAQRPAGGGWSAAQVVEHLVRVEGSVVRGARYTLAKGSKVKPGLLDPMRKLPLSLGLVHFVRVRTVRGADPAVDGGEPWPRGEAMARLDQSRQESIALLEQTREQDLSRLYLRHPFFGAFPLRDMLVFVAWHEERHRGQVVRIRRDLGRR